MNSKERVMNAINHKTVDRLPIDLWADNFVWEKLQKYYNATPEEILQKFGVDIRSIRPSSKNNTPIELNEKSMWFDEWGVGYKRIFNETGWHDDCVFHPLQDAQTVSDVEKYPWPDPKKFQFDNVEPMCRQNSEYALMGGNGHFFCPGADLRGYETWFMDIIEQSDVAQAIMYHMQQYWLEYSHQILETSNDLIDIFYLADDYSSQQGLMISIDCWKSFFRPYLKELVDLGKKSNKKIFFHSCGAVRKLIPELIDLGIDILNPIQIRAVGMDPKELVEEFGRDLCFHGGIDLQYTLCRGTPQDVRDEVNYLVDVLGKYNGYIIAPGHTIISDAPMENIIALFETANGQKTRI